MPKLKRVPHVVVVEICTDDLPYYGSSVVKYKTLSQLLQAIETCVNDRAKFDKRASLVILSQSSTNERAQIKFGAATYDSLLRGVQDVFVGVCDDDPNSFDAENFVADHEIAQASAAEAAFICPAFCLSTKRSTRRTNMAKKDNVIYVTTNAHVHDAVLAHLTAKSGGPVRWKMISDLATSKTRAIVYEYIITTDVRADALTADLLRVDHVVVAEAPTSISTRLSSRLAPEAKKTVMRAAKLGLDDPVDGFVVLANKYDSSALMLIQLTLELNGATKVTASGSAGIVTFCIPPSKLQIIADMDGVKSVHVSDMRYALYT
jgi:hypothetical protein